MAPQIFLDVSSKYWREKKKKKSIYLTKTCGSPDEKSFMKRVESCFSLMSLREEGQDLPQCSFICSAALLSWTTSALAVVATIVLEIYKRRSFCSQCQSWTDRRPDHNPDIHLRRISTVAVIRISFICQGKHSWWNICVVAILQRRKCINWEYFPLIGIWFTAKPTFWFACSLLSWNMGKNSLQSTLASWRRYFETKLPHVQKEKESTHGTCPTGS